jgi:hypothetical protein
LAEVLGLDRRDLFFLANPRAMELLRTKEDGNGKTAWEEFRRDERIRRTHNVTSEEMDLLSSVAEMGEIASPRDFIYILNTVRHALGR